MVMGVAARPGPFGLELFGHGPDLVEQVAMRARVHRSERRQGDDLASWATRWAAYLPGQH
jgi:hypothetical protein